MPTVVTKTSISDLDTIANRAFDAALQWAEMEPRLRAEALVAVADVLTQHSETLVVLAMDETGLSRTRLSGELQRTAVQMKLFADTVVDGAYLEVRIDEADDKFVLGNRPDLRRYRIPVGPVLNFSASNFPFAFSVAGGDTVAALAAGCSVVVKAHSGHLRLSALTGELVAQTLEAAGAPVGTLQVISGQAAGVAMLQQPQIAAGSFTGSLHIGRLLADIAAARPSPIPFYGELGSVNPVFVTAEAVAESGAEIAEGFVASISGSAGQLCTKPGFLFVPVGHNLDGYLAANAAAVEEHRLLTTSITRAYGRRRAAILATPGVVVVAHGSFQVDERGHGWATPTIVRIPAKTLRLERGTLLDEAFGPLSIVVEYDSLAAVVDISEELFDGNLTGTIHASANDTSAALVPLIRWLSKHSGRVLFGGWPTGVAVTPAMQHGGPWPATTNNSSTSVGTAAIDRFLRPVAYQNVPTEHLPPPLRDDNPWGVPQRRSRRGESHQWGSLSGASFSP